MGHIFKIRKATVELEIGGRTYAIVDPEFEKKVLIKAAWDEYEKNPVDEGADRVERMKKIREMNTMQILSYVPSMSAEDLSKMRESEIALTMEAIMAAAEMNFGAVLERPDEKKL